MGLGKRGEAGLVFLWHRKHTTLKPHWFIWNEPEVQDNSIHRFSLRLKTFFSNNVQAKPALIKEKARGICRLLRALHTISSTDIRKPYIRFLLITVANNFWVAGTKTNFIPNGSVWREGVWPHSWMAKELSGPRTPPPHCCFTPAPLPQVHSRELEGRLSQGGCWPAGGPFRGTKNHGNP